MSAIPGERRALVVFAAAVFMTACTARGPAPAPPSATAARAASPPSVPSTADAGAASLQGGASTGDDGGASGEAPDAAAPSSMEPVVIAADFHNPALGTVHFQVHRDGQVELKHGGSNERRRFVVSDADLETFRRSARSSAICAVKEKKDESLANSVSLRLDLQDLSCSVALTERQWSRNQRARRTMDALKHLMEVACGGPCPRLMRARGLDVPTLE